MYIRQVDKSHYVFKKYIPKERWLSVWHQLDEVLSLKPKKILELGPGPGLFKILACHLGILVETVDIDPELCPDHVASAIDLPFADDSYECVCAFQVLEHIPYDESLKAFQEMCRVAKHNVIISLPDSKKLWMYSLYIPKIGQRIIHIPKPQLCNSVHKFDGEHYWEINKGSYSLKKLIHDLTKKGVKLIKTYRVPENSYHRFFIFEKKML